MTVRDFERERLNKAGIKPIPFEPCQGLVVGKSRPHTHGECFGCRDWSQGRGGANRGNLITGPDGAPRCTAFRALVTAAQVEAVDETHGADCAPPVDGEKALPLGAPSAGCHQTQQHTGKVSE